MTRKEAREFVFKVLYQVEIQKDFDSFDLSKYTKDIELGNQDKYVRDLLNSIVTNLSAIDELINKNSAGWPVSRIAKIDLSILRLSIGEMKYLNDEVPAVVSINEAVSIAKIYGTEKSAGFVNAILGKCKN